MVSCFVGPSTMALLLSLSNTPIIIDLFNLPLKLYFARFYCNVVLEFTCITFALLDKYKACNYIYKFTSQFQLVLNAMWLSVNCLPKNYTYFYAIVCKQIITYMFCFCMGAYAVYYEQLIAIVTLFEFIYFNFYFYSSLVICKSILIYTMKINTCYYSVILVIGYIIDFGYIIFLFRFELITLFISSNKGHLPVNRCVNITCFHEFITYVLECFLFCIFNCKFNIILLLLRYKYIINFNDGTSTALFVLLFYFGQYFFKQYFLNFQLYSKNI